MLIDAPILLHCAGRPLPSRCACDLHIPVDPYCADTCLGLGVSAEGDGALYVPEVKRRGLLREIEAQRAGKAARGMVTRESVERLVGRLTHVAIVAPEGNAHLQPLYRVRCASYRAIRRSRLQNGSFAYRRVRAWPRSLQVGGTSAGAVEYQRALDWWQLALEKGVSAPGAQSGFPPPESRGLCVRIYGRSTRSGDRLRRVHVCGFPRPASRVSPMSGLQTV